MTRGLRPKNHVLWGAGLQKEKDTPSCQHHREDELHFKSTGKGCFFLLLSDFLSFSWRGVAMP